MGIEVSGWELAGAVAMQGEIGIEPQIFTGDEKLEEHPPGSSDTPHYTAKQVINYLYGQDR